MASLGRDLGLEDQGKEANTEELIESTVKDLVKFKRNYESKDSVN